MKQLIIQDPEILNGKPIIAGTRMSVESILELLGSGMDIQEIIKEYPYLTKEKITAAIKYASQRLQKEESYFFTKNHTKGA